eukprot:7480467-Karenia_brevis.AAC.1
MDINVSLLTGIGYEAADRSLVIRITPTTPMSRLMDKACELFKLPVDASTFRFAGEEIHGTDTATSLGIHSTQTIY